MYTIIGVIFYNTILPNTVIGNGSSNSNLSTEYSHVFVQEMFRLTKHTTTCSIFVNCAPLLPRHEAASENPTATKPSPSYEIRDDVEDVRNRPHRGSSNPSKRKAPSDDDISRLPHHHGYHQLRGAGSGPSPSLRRLLHLSWTVGQTAPKLSQKVGHRHQEPEQIPEEGRSYR